MARAVSKEDAKTVNRVVVVTGASAGVGRATAVAFARDGAAVAVLARSQDGLEGAVRDINSAGARVLAIPTDVADADQVEAAAEQVETELGPIDVWVNNAMVTVFSKAAEMTAEEYKRVTEVTYLGTVHGTQAALKRMRPRDAGVVIQVGSALAYRGIPLQSAYCAAKFAIRGFTDSLRVELLHEQSNIHLTMVQLAAFNTPQFDWARHRLAARPQPLPPIFQPELAAGAIVWSSHHKRRELFVGFPTFKTIIGTKLFPQLADKMACEMAVDGQMDTGALPPKPDREDNLFTPLPGDHGAHGRFDAQARSWSWQLTLTKYRTGLWLAGAAAIAVVAAVIVF